MPEEIESILDIKSTNSSAQNSAVAEESVWSFRGRIRRGQFWARFFLLQALNLGLSLFISALGASIEEAWPLVLIIALAWVVFAVWFGLAFQVKRWHDLNLSGWMVLLNFTLIALPICIIILGFIRGTSGSNKYGIDPLQSQVGLNLGMQESSDAQTNLPGDTPDVP